MLFLFLAKDAKNAKRFFAPLRMTEGGAAKIKTVSPRHISVTLNVAKGLFPLRPLRETFYFRLFLFLAKHAENAKKL